ncbi:hypothetical protein LCGC14_1515650 [marine sediment metagenome]|uniref:Rhodanese domain-containing protein n=1 Tax=marine sediment metagenome TaxID=412755 RepID=A0A0F9J082_9ZZZZ
MIKKDKNSESLIILDVRDTKDFNLGHLYDSILIPINELVTRIGELEDHKTSEIIIYCKSGSRSQQASEILVEYGFTKVYKMEGGILAWIDADYPIWTVSHHITVDEITDEKFELLIEPFLLYNKGCSTSNEDPLRLNEVPYLCIDGKSKKHILRELWSYKIYPVNIITGEKGFK